MQAATYSPRVRELLAEERLSELDPGKPNDKIRAKLAGASAADLLAPDAVRSPDCAEACLAALWLYHDFLDESHNISQSITTVEGSYWHAIMHRREPDASNAAYWFRRVGTHPVFADLFKEGRRLGLELSAKDWDPFEFTDLCEKHRGAGTPQETLLRQVQKREWGLLFDWCWQRAVGHV
jgi:hypothetical protein